MPPARVRGSLGSLHETTLLGRGLRLIAELAPDTKRRLSVDESVDRVRRDHLFLATGDLRFDGECRLDVRRIFPCGARAAAKAE